MAKLTHTVSGNVASFRSADKVNIESLKVHFLPVQEGSGDPSPNNVRNINGWNSCNVYTGSKNIGHIIGYSVSTMNSPTATRSLADSSRGKAINTINFSSPDTPMIITQTQWFTDKSKSSYQNGYYCIGLDNLIFGKTYDFSFKVTNITNNPLDASLSDIRVWSPGAQHYSSATIKDNVLIFKNVTWKQYTASQEGLKRCTFEIYNCGMSFTLSEFMVTPAGMNDGVFEPYCGSIIPITFPDNQVIYGGYIDLITGELVATHAIITYDGSSDEGWSKSGDTYSWSSECFCIAWNDIGRVSSNPNIYNKCICDSAIVSTNTDRDPQDINGIHVSYYHYSNVGYHAPLGADATVAQLRTYLAEHPLTIVQPYVLESNRPKYYLTTEQLKTFLNYNNIWSNTNDITEVTYEVIDHLNKKRAAIPKQYTVLWNNFQEPFSTTYYKAYMDSRSMIEDVEPGIIKHTYLVTTDTGYRTSTRMKDNYEPTVYTSHKYYLSYMLYTPMTDKQFGAEAFGGTTFTFGVIPANQWTRLSFYGNGVRNGSGFGYFGILRSYASGDEMYTLLKSPIYIDLTLMFGAGNEPTKQEFEDLCALNNVDLTASYPRDLTGTKMIWRIK